MASRARSTGANRPLSPTAMRSRGTSGARRSLVPRVVSKVFRSRLLMPISRDFSFSARSSSPSSWTSSRTSMPSATRGVLELARLPVADRRHDDENAIGAPGPRFGDLVGLVEEILAQHRQRAGCARRDEMIGAALERGRVGEHRQAAGAARLVGARQRGRIELGADQPLRRARLLDLGDERIGAAGEAALDRLRRSRAAARPPWPAPRSSPSGRARLAAAISSRL